MLGSFKHKFLKAVQWLQYPVSVHPKAGAGDLEEAVLNEAVDELCSEPSLQGQPAQSDPRLKLLFVSHDLSQSGAPCALWYLAQHLVSSGHEVTVLAPADGPLRQRYEGLGITVEIRGRAAWPTHQGDVVSLGHIVSPHQVVIANTIVMSQVVRVAARLQKPCIWWIHESLYGQRLATSRPPIAAAFAAADAVVVPARSTGKTYRDWVPANQLFVVKYGFDVCNMTKIVDDSMQPLAGFSVVHVGSVEPRKGQDLLLRGLEGLPREIGQQISCYFVGRVLDRAFERTVKRVASRIKNVHFVGEVPHGAALGYIQGSNIFALTSRDEVLPMSLLEAMALGKTIIVTDVGGIPEAIQHRKHGFLVSADRPQEITDALLRLFRDRELAAALGEGACARFEAAFTAEKFAEGFAEVIGKVMGKPQGSQLLSSGRGER